MKKKEITRINYEISKEYEYHHLCLCFLLLFVSELRNGEQLLVGEEMGKKRRRELTRESYKKVLFKTKNDLIHMFILLFLFTNPLVHLELVHLAYFEHPLVQHLVHNQSLMVDLLVVQLNLVLNLNQLHLFEFHEIQIPFQPFLQ
eukprot:UN03849